MLLFALLPFVLHGNGIAYPDEGVYAAQAETLAHGSWFEERPAAELRGLEALNGLGPEVVKGNLFAGYVRHSLYMRLLVPFWRLGGFGALFLPSIVGGALAALASGLIARRLERRLAVPSLWLAAVASPLVFDSYLVAAHTLAAAAVGFAALGALSVIAERQLRSLWWALPTVAAAVFLRSEGVLFGGALAFGVGIVCLRDTWRRRWAPAAKLAVATMAIAGAASGSFFLDAAFARQVSGRSSPVETTSRILGAGTGPLHHIWLSLVMPGFNVGVVLPIVVSCCALLAGVLVHRVVGSRLGWVQVGVLVLAATSTVWMNFGALTLVTGLLTAFPFLVVGLVALPRFGGDESRWYLTAVSATALVLLVLTGYSVGGATEWGGRFYLPLVVILTPLAVSGLGSWVRALEQWGRPAVAALAVVAIGTGVFEVRVNADRRETASVLERGVSNVVLAQPRPDKPLVIVGGVDIGGESRTLWARRSQLSVLIGPTLEDIFRIVRFAAANGYHEVYVLIPMRDPLVRQLAVAWLEPIGWMIGPRNGFTRTGFGLYRAHAISG